MTIRITKLIFLLVLAVSCETTTTDHKDRKSENVSIDQESIPSQSSPIDTNRIIETVTQDILNRLQGQQIRKSDFDKQGNYYIEFNEDTTNADPDDIIWEYYLIEKNELLIGNLNSDDIPDFAIKSTWGPTKGNMFGLEWHIYVSENGEYKRVENDFGGGKFSDTETVTAIDREKLKTKFQELDEETAWLNDSVELREYQLTDNELKRIK